MSSRRRVSRLYATLTGPEPQFRRSSRPLLRTQTVRQSQMHKSYAHSPGRRRDREIIDGPSLQSLGRTDFFRANRNASRGISNFDCGILSNCGNRDLSNPRSAVCRSRLKPTGRRSGTSQLISRSPPIPPPGFPRRSTTRRSTPFSRFSKTDDNSWAKSMPISPGTAEP